MGNGVPSVLAYIGALNEVFGNEELKYLYLGAVCSEEVDESSSVILRAYLEAKRGDLPTCVRGETGITTRPEGLVSIGTRQAVHQQKKVY